MTAEVTLSRGLVALVDDQDVERVSQFKWCAVPSRKTFYAIHCVRTPPGRTGRKHDIRMHRFIVDAPDGFLVDHADMNGLNNQRTNLRICNLSENQRNRGPNRNTRSGYKGVHWHAQNNKWAANLRLDHKTIYLGVYNTPEAAARAYDVKALELFGEFAYLNFPGGAQ